MRTWQGAERALRREAAQTLGGHTVAVVRPPVVVVGAGRPAALIGLRGFDPDRPSRTVAELVLLAAGFRPDRVLVAMAVPTAPRDRRGVLLATDVQAVADGLVEVSRAWAWRRVGKHVWWLPAEVRSWMLIDERTVEVARAIIDERPETPEPEVLDHLLARSVAAGHHVRLGRASGSDG